MNKILFSVLMILIFPFGSACLDCEGPELAPDYSDPAVFGDLDPSEVNIASALDQGMGDHITPEQWAHGNNLAHLDDIRTYPNAMVAVQDQHVGTNINLDAGSITYDNGVITNNGVSLDLNDQQFAGASVTALEDGGFAIHGGYGISHLTIDEFDIDLTNPASYVEIQDEGKLVLSPHATVTDSQGNRVSTNADKNDPSFATVTQSNGVVTVTGPAIVQDEFGGTLIVDGSATIDHARTTLGLETAGYAVEDVSITIDGIDVEGSTALVMDEGQMNAVSHEVVTAITRAQQMAQQKDRGFTMGDFVDAAARNNGINLRSIEEQTAIPMPVVAVLGVSGAVALDQVELSFPTSYEMSTKEGTFSSAIGFQEGSYSPFVQFNANGPAVPVRLKDGTLTQVTNPTQRFSATLSGGPNSIRAHFEMNGGGNMRISYSPGKQGGAGTLRYEKKFNDNVAATFTAQGNGQFGQLTFGIYGRI